MPRREGEIRNPTTHQSLMPSSTSMLHNHSLLIHPRLHNQLTFTATIKVLKPSCPLPLFASSPIIINITKNPTFRPTKCSLLYTHDLVWGIWRLRVNFDWEMGKLGLKSVMGHVAFEGNEEWCC